MRKVHLMSMIGVDYDWELVPFFIEHYKRFDFDSYTIFLHSNKHIPHARREQYLSAIREQEKWDAAFVNIEGGYWAGGKEAILQQFAQGLPGWDYVVTADADELHDMPPRTYKELILSRDLVMGALVDCYDNDTLAPVQRTVPLELQYPRGSNIEALNVGRCGEINRTKIMANRAHAPVSYIGNHVYWEDIKQLNVSSGHDVLHYTFRPCLPWRMATRWYNRPETVAAVCARFGINFHPAIALCEKEQVRRINEGGWIPGADAEAIAGREEAVHG